MRGGAGALPPPPPPYGILFTRAAPGPLPVGSSLKFVLTSCLSPASPTQPAVIRGCNLAFGKVWAIVWGVCQPMLWGGGHRSRQGHLPGHPLAVSSIPEPPTGDLL